MKRYILTVAVTCISLFLVSWGRTGHETVALIAENHLTPEAKAAVKEFLGNQSLADVSNWADEVKGQSEYRKTDTWHYIDVPLGLSYDEFKNNVIYQGKNTVYYEIEVMMHTLEEPAVSTANEKKQALMFLIHFVGDAHQPMHVSRKEDKGSNIIRVKFDNSNTNLYALWDSKLIDHQGLSYEQMAKDYDTASPDQIKEWQHDDIMKWLYESYQISTKLYAEVKQSDILDNSYYDTHIRFIKQRIEMAGIRLAGVLNAVFKDYYKHEGYQPNPNQYNGIKTDPNLYAFGYLDSPSDTVHKISIFSTDVLNHVGQRVEFTAQIKEHEDMGKLTFIDIGRSYPNQLLTIVMRGRVRYNVKVIDSRTILVRGVLFVYQGKPYIEIRDTTDYKILW